jgi:Uma2 family endonuclease
METITLAEPSVQASIQLTDAQTDKLYAGQSLWIRASWDEFEEFLPTTPYRVEYHNGHIIIMGLARFIHEVLVGRMLILLAQLYKGNRFFVAGSNVGLPKASNPKGHYNPDVVVVKGQPVYQKGSNALIENPYLVVEVLSESTVAYDLTHKLFRYMAMPTIQIIVFVDRFTESGAVITHHRTETPNVWTETYYADPNDVVLIDGQPILLKEIFADLPDEPDAR